MNDATDPEADVDRADAVDSLTSWTIVALGLLTLLLIWGTIFTFTVYADALAEAFGLSPFRTSSVFSVTAAGFYVAGGLLGVLVARLPLRPVVAASGVAIGAAVGLLQVVSSYPGLLAAFGLLGAASGTVFVVVVSLVPQWFERHEGTAMGVTFTGNGFGVLVLPFVWAWLLERVDVRVAFGVVGGGIVAVVLLASLVYRRPPHVRESPGSAGVDVAWLRSMLADSRFLATLAGFALLWSWYFVIADAMVEILTTAGIARGLATTAFGLIGGISIVSRLVGGVVGDRFGHRITLVAGVSLAALGMFALVPVSTPTGMYATLLVFGIGLGAVAALFSPIVLGRFGPENATAIVGLLTLSEASTSFLTPVAASATAAATGGYAVPLVAVGLATLLGAGLFYWGTDPAAGPT